jgi:hypothetical protein
MNDIDKQASDSTIEFTAAVFFRPCGVEMKLVLPGVAQQNDSSRLVKPGCL